MSDREDQIEGERNLSQVSSGRRGMSQWQKMAVYGLGTAAIITVVFWRDSTHKPAEVRTAPQQMGQLATFERPAAPVPIPVALTPPLPTPQPTLGEMFRAAAQQPAITAKQPPPAKRMLSYASVATAKTEAPTPQPVATPEQTGAAFKAGRIPGAKAGPAMDLTYMLMPGVVKCTLNNAINTTQPGPIFCETSEDVYSPMHVKLMEAHTKIVGSYSSSVQQGQNRLPAVSAFAITPSGVPIALTSPMGDALGRSGFPGQVDTHFGARFGGALLLLAAQGAIGGVQTALQHGSGNSYLNLNTGGLESAVSEVLRNSINIPPTITVNQGEEIAFLVTIPIDFKDAYELRSVP